MSDTENMPSDLTGTDPSGFGRLRRWFTIAGPERGWRPKNAESAQPQPLRTADLILVLALIFTTLGPPWQLPSGGGHTEFSKPLETNSFSNYH